MIRTSPFPFRPLKRDGRKSGEKTGFEKRKNPYYFYFQQFFSILLSGIRVKHDGQT
ncbi:hypothetical protein B4135_1381 [Caldibacillus debilis]|uniref:Uncharacterized protein n=1 Tax=Caldibacillus debilis TaxID=301148 RepID=A0A150MCU0_9BACI|nr:hypothetical protein B4135_1381 [Caldibacillus debilis]